MQDSTELKTTFNRAARLYDKARPTYPPELFTALIQQTGINARSNLLEIGPGTGQATLPLASLGCQITAVELGPDLANVARENLAQYPRVEVVTGSFEDVLLPEAAFDLVYSATAFHWIKPENQFRGPHTLLKTNGHLAIIHTVHIGNAEHDLFYNASHKIYEHYGLAPTHFPDGRRRPPQGLPRLEDIKATALDETLFEPVYFRCFLYNVTYTARGYTELLYTYSPNLALPETQRQGFLSDIEELINTSFGGQIVKPFGMSLTIGKRKP